MGDLIEIELMCRVYAMRLIVFCKILFTETLRCVVHVRSSKLLFTPSTTPLTRLSALLFGAGWGREAQLGFRGARGGASSIGMLLQQEEEDSAGPPRSSEPQAGATGGVAVTGH